MSTEIVKMSLRRMRASDTTAIVCVEYTTSLIISEDLLKRIAASPIVDQSFSMINMTDNTPHPHIIAIITQPGTTYIDAEPALMQLIANWYEEYCGAVDAYHTLQFTHDDSSTGDFIFHPNQHSTRARYGDFKVRRAMAGILGEGSDIPAYDYLLKDLADQLGISE